MQLLHICHSVVVYEAFTPDTLIFHSSSDQLNFQTLLFSLAHPTHGFPFHESHLFSTRRLTRCLNPLCSFHLTSALLFRCFSPFCSPDKQAVIRLPLFPCHVSPSGGAHFSQFHYRLPDTSGDRYSLICSTNETNPFTTRDESFPRIR